MNLGFRPCNSHASVTLRLLACQTPSLHTLLVFGRENRVETVLNRGLRKCRPSRAHLNCLPRDMLTDMQGRVSASAAFTVGPQANRVQSMSHVIFFVLQRYDTPVKDG